VSTTEGGDVAALADRIETLLGAFDSVATPRQSRERAEQLVRTILGVYGAGLERLLSIVHESLGERSEEVFERLCEDRLVESLLCLHDLHPLSLEERVQRALDSVRPYLKSHEGGIEIVAIEAPIVYLRLEGSCDGCPSSAATVRLAVERAILERVPEIREVRAEGVAAAAPAASLPGSGSLRMESEWLPLARVPELESKGLAALEIDGMPVLLVRLDETLYAYRNRCAACAAGFAGAALERPFVSCPHCGAAYDVVRAGRARDGAGAFIEPFPLSREDGRIRVAIPLGVP
jgi:Fe-S cluster biogenesis protein NfuA/nitrite reductase/ring-hydroxylating ferredoxin subunit